MADETIIKPPETSRPGAVICIGGSTLLPPAFRQQHQAVAIVRKTQDLKTSNKRKIVYSAACGSESVVKRVQPQEEIQTDRHPRNPNCDY
jgi:hypothetical protein